MTYFLRTARLGFRCWTEADAALAERLWGDAEVTGFLGGPFSAEACRDRLEREMVTQEVVGVQYWPMFVLETGEHAGCAGFRPTTGEAGVLEMGVHVARAMWGTGIGEEAARAMMAYGFEQLGLTAIVAGRHPENRASERLLGRLGFRFTHEAPWGAAGLLHPMYRVERTEWVGL